jgi:hypothetical protein
MDHEWKFDGFMCFCARCGHSFSWSKKPPKFTNSDGSPSREDKDWFHFQIAGLMSFIDAGENLSQLDQSRFVKIAGMDSDSVGTHAAAFENCGLEEEFDNYVEVLSIIEE